MFIEEGGEPEKSGIIQIKGEDTLGRVVDAERASKDADEHSIWTE